MLRPATPLTILFFVAFVLLLISTISTPIVEGIPLAKFNGVSFGVFGYCRPTGCSSIQIGYPVGKWLLKKDRVYPGAPWAIECLTATEIQISTLSIHVQFIADHNSADANSLFGNADNDNSDFSLPTGARSDLSSILIVHPIAALLNLICFILAATSHVRSPSHSPRYLLALIIMSIPTLLVTLLAFLVDILLFVPHLAWGGWIVLAATILILASGIITCAMRRTLVSRKARKKRIAENAEMNGENFYARQAPPPAVGMDRAESPPPLPSHSGMSGGLGSDRLPKFATFDTKASPEEDTIPLNTRTPSNKTLPSMPTIQGAFPEDGFHNNVVPRRGGPGGMRGGRGGYSGPKDEYGNPLPPSNAFGHMPPAGMRRDQSEPPRLRNQYSDETMNSQGSRGRGRGGFGPPRGYGRGGPRGGPYGPGPGRGGRGGRGGYGRGGIPLGPMAAGAGPGMMGGEWRGTDPPPPGYGYGNGYPPQNRPGQYDGPGPAGYGRSPSAPGYGRRPSPGPPSAPGGYGRQQSPGPSSAPGGYRRGPSPGPPSAPGGYGRGPSPGPPSAPGGYGRGPSPGPPSAAYGYAPGQPSHELPMPQYQNEALPPSPMDAHPPEDHLIGQAIEMDARHGSPPTRSPTFHQPMQLHDSDSDVRGLVGMQQNQGHRDSSSVYSANE